LLNHNELSFAIFGNIVILIVTYVVLRIQRGSKKPRGSISEDVKSSSEVNRLPANPVLLIACIGWIICVITYLRLFGHCFNNSWESSDLYKQAIQFPILVNYIGIAVLWFCGSLKASVLVYNINFTPCILPMKKGYTLATGGPYRCVRHPKYLHDILAALSLFMMTGIQELAIGLLCCFAFIFQAYSEEKALRKIFGKAWKDYASQTGMFIPKMSSR